MKIGRVIFFDIVTGITIIDTGEYSNAKRKKTIDEQIATYNPLTNRNRDSFGVIELEYGQYAQDFAECTSYRVNIESRQLEFSYEPIDDDNEPIYRAPLSEEVDDLKQQVANTDELVMSLLEMMYLQ